MLLQDTLERVGTALGRTAGLAGLGDSISNEATVTLLKTLASNTSTGPGRNRI